MKKEELLKYYYGYDTLKEEQSKIVDSVINGNDTIGILPTGYGKSITFQLPALMLDGITLVITPLIALMQDQVMNLKRRGIKAEYINSLLDDYQTDKIYRDIKADRIKLLYVSAERLENKRFINEIKNSKISLIVCDEAHTLIWSENFRLALGHIPKFIELLTYKPTILALTATANKEMISKICTYLRINNPALIVGACDRKNIFYRVIRSRNKLGDLVSYIFNHKEEKGIIYCVTIKNAKKVYQYLKSIKMNVGIYHGMLDSKEKELMQSGFSNNDIKIMVCTNAFGMGIDVPDIRYVVEYDMPHNLEDFAQQIGRASRDGNYAEGIVLFNTTDIKTANYFIEHLDVKEKSYEEQMKIKKDKYIKLDKMIEFCITKKCLHKYVVNYFNQEHNGKCGMCVNCK